MRHIDAAERANIYEVNIRQYTPEGSFEAFERHLPRLAAMGVDILWLMPVHPIGVKHRKGSLGSSYSVRDYTAVNPEFGTLADFRRLVKAAHALGMLVLIDWVANHTAWDHAWVSEHPDWYKKDEHGRIHAYTYQGEHGLEHWTDVVGLDYRQHDLWPAMTDALAWWLRETDIDGYRCDVAGLVPTPFWEQARRALDAIKPVFMLAEWSDVALHRSAFDMSYDWPLYDTMCRIARGDGDARDMDAYLEADAARGFPPHAIRMLFTTNHDKNAWEGHDGERFGAAFKVFAVLAATLPGMPLVYGGQEAGLHRRLAFFEKDTIDWGDRPHEEFYRGLLRLKHDNAALANGAAGGDLLRIATGDDAVFAFRRRRGANIVSVTANLSAMPRGGIEPWGYRIEVRNG